MSGAFESIVAGLEEAIPHACGRPVPIQGRRYEALDVKAIRAQVGMSQAEFAGSFGISLGTLRHWERGDRRPHGPARVLLMVLAKQPKAVLKALAA